MTTEPIPLRPGIDDRTKARGVLHDLIHRVTDDGRTVGDDIDTCAFAGNALELGMAIALLHPDFAARVVLMIGDPPYDDDELEFAVAIAHGETC